MATKFLEKTSLQYLITWIKEQLTNKVDEEPGKGLSTNDYTTAEKTKLAGIGSGAEANVIENITLNGEKASVANKTAALTIDDMGAATSSSAGTNGLVPAPAAGDQTKYLRGDGTWVTPPNTTYSEATVSKAGLLSASDKAKLDTVTENADAVSFTQKLTSGTEIGTLTINGTATKLYSTNNTTYSAATDAKDGLMSKTDKAKLDAFSDASDYALKSDITSAYIYKGSVATYDDLPTSGQSVGDVYNVEDDGMNYAWNGTEWDALGSTLTIDTITTDEIDEMTE